MKAFAQLVSLSLLATVATAVNNFHGINVANSASTGSYTCRTQAQWNTIAANAKASGFGSIRILGFDCDALNRASTAAAAQGMTVLAGIWVDGTMASSAGSIANDLAAFVTAHSRFGAGRFRGLTVGNEVNDSGANIMNKVNEARNYLRARGITLPVSTVHTWVFIRANRGTMCNTDFIGANAHAFYDGNFVSGKTGDFVFKTVIPELKAACPGRTIRITESGWPSRGANHGVAVASLADARNALLNLNCACRDDRNVGVFAFESDDMLWKGNENERSYGILGKFNLLGDVFAPC